MVDNVSHQKPVLIPQDGDPRAGIFGGQGPAAGADAAAIFQSVQGKKAMEQEYVGSVLLNDPKIPDRSAFIKDNTQPDPLPAMQALIAELNSVKRVSVMFIPCNTAHNWHRNLAHGVNALLLNMPRATVKHLLEENIPAGSKIGVMCTEGTKQQALYTKALEKAGYVPVYPGDEDQKAVNDGIYEGVKKNDIAEGTRQMKPVLEKLINQGCAKVLLACTEIPMALGESQIGKTLAPRTLNPVTAVAKRTIHHINSMNEAKARGKTTYDAGSDADVSASENEEASQQITARIQDAPGSQSQPRALRRMARKSDLGKA